MITTELINSLELYGLSIIALEKEYCLVEKDSGECYACMSIYYIESLVSNWNKYHSMI